MIQLNSESISIVHDKDSHALVVRLAFVIWIFMICTPFHSRFVAVAAAAKSDECDILVKNKLQPHCNGRMHSQYFRIH